MMIRRGSQGITAHIILVGFLVAVGAISAHAAEVLVSDRLTSSIWRYSESGALLGLVVQDTTNLSFSGGGMALSADGTHLYVSNRSPARIVRYDFNGTTATNPLVVADTVDYPLSNLAGLTFSPDGATLYAGGNGGVAQFTTGLVPAGAKLATGTGGNANSTAVGLNPNGDLLALTTLSNAVRYDGSAFVSFAPGAGLGAMTVHGDDLFVVGAFTPTLRKFDAVTGSPDASFGVAGTVNTDPLADGSGSWPSSIAVAPDDNNSLLIGILTGINGAGHISRFALDGTNLGIWANHVDLPDLGFGEATGLLVIPEPSSLFILGAATAMLVTRSRKRRAA